MIQILSKDDLSKVNDPVIVAGLNKEFDRLPDNYEYPEYGYFLVIERLEELTNPVELNSIISQHTTHSLEDCLELIEESTGYYQVLLILHADFGVSLFVSTDQVTIEQLEVLFGV